MSKNNLTFKEVCIVSAIWATAITTFVGIILLAWD
jgi:hypothetical protein